jgi:tetrahydromethanopterin S-methyltransferase subunit D
MSGSNFAFSLLLSSMILAVLVIVVGSIVLLLRSSDKGLVGLSLLACAAALVFDPLLRVLPEQISIYLFFVGFFPISAIILAAAITSTARLMQTRRWASVPSLLASMVAASLMYINTTSPWIWPYAKF